MTVDTDPVERVLEARLDGDPSRPVGVAFSGGGDSLALLLIAKAWADRAGRTLIAFTVDHRLQAQSGEWAGWCVHRAGRLGVNHQILVWDGPKPARGGPAAARGARHRLIADAAREAGARVVLFGHTADDLIEADLMSAGGVRMSRPAEWSPSPVWPEGRGLFLVRPMLGFRRAAIRQWLPDRGETWIEDPANEDLNHPRVRARALAATAPLEPEPGHRLTPTFAGNVGCSGEIMLSNGLLDMSIGRLGAMVVCASGSERPPRREALERLAGRLAAGEPNNATLGGARIVRASESLIFARETTDTRGRACRAVAPRAGECLVWDGRFEIRALEEGLAVSALRGHAARLDASERAKLSALRPEVRSAVPAVIDAQGAVVCPTVTPDPRIEVRHLVPGRMFGAIGMVDSEARIGMLG